MRLNRLVVVFLLLGLGLGAKVPQCRAQSFEWGAGAYAFFDDGEYAGLDNRYSQTMAGFRFSPEVGLGYKDFSLFVGAHLQTEFGSPKFLDYAYFTGYFRYNTDSPRSVKPKAADGSVQARKVNHDFIIGAFPRQGLLDEYTTFYIRDTFHHYRPNITGIYYKLSGVNTASDPHAADNYLKFYLDWTGHRSRETRETFFVGLSGQYRYKWFFAALNGYYYHYSLTKPNSGDGKVHDNGQGQAGIGIDFSESAPRLHYARFQAAYMLGYECKRDHTTPVKMPMGLVLDLHLQYWRIGTRTLYYYGQPRYTVPTDNFSNTYWGDPFLSTDPFLGADPTPKTHSYLCSQWYVSLFRNAFVEARAMAELNLKGKKFGSRYLVQLCVNLRGAVHAKRTMEELECDRATFNFLGADARHRELDAEIRRKKE